ncbi:MAG: PEP-CTERM sorting domain-containing protein [Planctomycetota bacterium]|nr:PEP-CTERM sorting domain-containing protein [Planctomycetota bacterium]
MKTSGAMGMAVVLSVLLMAAPARGFTTWDGEGGDGLWDAPANWNPDGVPAPGGDEVRVANGAQITSNGTHSFPGVVRLGYGTVNGLVKVTQTAGAATGAGQFTMGPTSTYDLQGGSFTQTGTGSYDGLYIGFDGGDLGTAHGTLIVSGGTLAAQRLYISRQRAGVLQVVGGLGAINIVNVEPRESSGGTGFVALQPNANALSPINASGGVDINGISLSVAFSADPTLGHVFTVINKTSTGPVAGTFTGLAEGGILSVPKVGAGGTWDLLVSYAGGDGNDVTLTVGGTAGWPDYLPGDFNLDGEVGPEDFGILKDGFGLDGLPFGNHESWTLGDANDDGEIGPEDFGLLKDNFGLDGGPTGTYPLTNVPEPASLLALLGVSILSGLKRRPKA